MFDFEYTIKRSKRKSVAIQIINGEVVVKAPLKYPDKKIHEFVLQKQKWINKHLTTAKNKPKVAYDNGEDFHFLGKIYTIKIIPIAIQEKVEIYDNELIIFSHKKINNLKHNKSIIDKWINEQTQNIFTKRYDECFKLFDYKRKPIFFIKTFKARWGAYHKQFLKEHITLNKNLIMYPVGCLDYVIIHELAHKKYPNHSKDFYSFVESKMPNWKEYKNILSGKVD